MSAALRFIPAWSLRKTYDPNPAVPDYYFAIGRKWPKLAPDFIKPWDNTKGATGAQIDQVTACLDAGIPVAAGLWWPTQGNFRTVHVAGVDLMATPDRSKVAGGHSIAIVGYRIRAAYRCKEGVKVTRQPDKTEAYEWSGEWGWRFLLDRKFTTPLPKPHADSSRSSCFATELSQAPACSSPGEPGR